MPATSPSSTDLRAWLYFVFASELGALQAARLLAAFGNPRSAQLATDHELADMGLSGARIRALRRTARIESAPLRPDLEQILDWGQQARHAILTPLHAEYPALLRNIPVPPPILYRIGEPLAGSAGIAVVGARKATAAGCATASTLAGQLASRGMLVISGMACGIDTAAHQGALDQNGRTVAVLGCGPDVIYPRSNAALYQRIVNQGTVISEFPPGAAPRKHHFPQRNRLISGLGHGTVVVEAGLRSGSLSTARHALEQGREVFAVPGSVHSPNSRGPHQLIRDGAHLVEGVEDVLNNLPDWAPVASGGGPAQADLFHAAPPTLRKELSRVWQALEFHPLSLDQLIVRSGLPAPVVSSALSELEIDGHARMEGCGYARVCAG